MSGLYNGREVKDNDKMETKENNDIKGAAATSAVSDMTVGSPMRCITRFALPLILGYILQQIGRAHV